METHNFVIPDNDSKKGDMCHTDLQAAVDIVPASAFSVPCVAAKCKAEVLLSQFTVPKLVTKFAAFYGAKYSLSCSQEPAMCSYPKSDESSLYPQILLL